MILIGIGANLPDENGRPPLETCRWAVAQLDALPGLRLGGLSRWFRTAPAPASDQPDFVNGVALLCGFAAPLALLAALHGIETLAGRRRGAVNAARTLDLDLLAMNDLITNGPTLIVPHPRLQERAFVLAPLCDVAPTWRHPALHRTAEAMLADTDMSGVQLV